MKLLELLRAHEEGFARQLEQSKAEVEAKVLHRMREEQATSVPHLSGEGPAERVCGCAGAHRTTPLRAARRTRTYVRCTAQRRDHRSCGYGGGTSAPRM